MSRRRGPYREICSLVAVVVLFVAVAGCSPTKSPRANVGVSKVLFGIAPTGGAPDVLMPWLHSLAGKEPFLLHIYAGWQDGDGTNPAWLAGLLDEVRSYGRNGFEEELVVRYESTKGDVSGYCSFLTALVHRIGRFHSIVSLQVTNEANSPLDRAASDGGFPDAAEALVRGVQTAHRAAVASHASLVVGFNVAFPLTVGELRPFFSSLYAIGGDNFAHDVGFVGLDLYPGTYLPSLPAAPSSPGFSTTASDTVANTLTAFRNEVLPAAHISSKSPIELTEIGFATSTSWHHTYAEQATLVKAFAAGACRIASRVDLRAFEWFDLTDAPAPAPSLSAPALHLPWQFGLLTDRRTPKAGFSAYRSIVAAGCH